MSTAQPSGKTFLPIESFVTAFLCHVRSEGARTSVSSRAKWVMAGLDCLLFCLVRTLCRVL